MTESPVESRIVTDGITDLHNLTLSFVNRFSDLLTSVLVKASEVKATSTEERMKYEEEVWADCVCERRLGIVCPVSRRTSKRLNRLWTKWMLSARRSRLAVGEG